MTWDSMKRAKQEGGGSGAFISLKDGDQIEGVFRGEPYSFYQVFKDKTEYSEWAAGRNYKFKINLIIKEPNGELKPKIFQGGATLRDLLLDAKEEYGLDTVFKIKRTGSGKDDTRYSILYKSTLTPLQVETMNAIKLLPLKKASEEVFDIPPPEDMPMFDDAREDPL